MANATTTRKIDVSMYDFNVEAFMSQNYRLDTRTLRVQWASDDAVPEHVKYELTESCRGVSTNGNGACAIHAQHTAYYSNTTIYFTIGFGDVVDAGVILLLCSIRAPNYTRFFLLRICFLYW